MAKSNAPRAPKATAQPKAPKVKTAVCLSAEAMKRLGLACVDLEMDQSEIVEWLINANLSGYVLQVRGPVPALGKYEGQADPSAPVMVPGSAIDADRVNSPSLSGV